MRIILISLAIAGCLLIGTAQSFSLSAPRSVAHRSSPVSTLKLRHPKSAESPLGRSSLISLQPILSFPRPTALKSSPSHGSNGQEPTSLPRKVTGFGFAAIRSSIRATTGLSLTAMRTFLRTLTGISISRVMKSALGLLPPWFRYFFQPFLIMYYVPLTILKGLIGSTPTSKMEDRSSHETLVQYWKDAVKLAEDRSADWPLHVMADGSMKYDLEDDKMNDKIVEAVEMRNESEQKH